MFFVGADEERCEERLCNSAVCKESVETEDRSGIDPARRPSLRQYMHHARSVFLVYRSGMSKSYFLFLIYNRSSLEKNLDMCAFSLLYVWRRLALFMRGL